MIKINKYLNSIRPYKVASHKVWKITPEERNSILKLDWNEATCEPSPSVKQRLFRLLETSFLNLYPDTNNDEIYNCLSEYTGLPKENIQYFGSSDSLHEYISRLYVTVGDNILILWPSYDNLRLTMQTSGANVSFFELEKDFSFNPERFEEEIEKANPKLVYICNPNNPTGTILGKDYIRSLVQRFPDSLFLIDEAYIEFEQDQTCKDLVVEYDNILITRTLSKAFGLANIRFGYIMASQGNIEALSNIRNPKNITTFAQEAAIGALSDIDYMKEYVEEVKKARRFLIDSINTQYGGKLKAYESHGNFVLVDCFNQKTKINLLRHLEDNNIFIRAVGQSDSVKNCVRISIGDREKISRVLKTIENFIIMEE